MALRTLSVSERFFRLRLLALLLFYFFYYFFVPRSFVRVFFVGGVHVVRPVRIYAFLGPPQTGGTAYFASIVTRFSHEVSCFVDGCEDIQPDTFAMPPVVQFVIGQTTSDNNLYTTNESLME